MEKFDLVVIGGGAGGLYAARRAAELGASVAIVEKRLLGGDTLHFGCVPSKTMVRAAGVAQLCHRADIFGIRVKGVAIDFQAVMERRHLVQARMGEDEGVEHLRSIGVEVIFGEGHFLDPHRFQVGSRVIAAQAFVIATGSRPAELDIPGLSTSAHLTNETILGLLELPKRLIVIGAGPIGMEYAQLMQRLGSRVMVFERLPHILPKEDSEIAEELRKLIVAEGVEIYTGANVERVERSKQGIAVHCQYASREMVLEADQLLVAVGRTPNVEGLGLHEIGVITTKSGIGVDTGMRTSRSNIFAVGDAAGPYHFTHIAEFQAETAVGNALIPFARRRIDYRAVPWVTFTSPELAKVGLSEAEAREQSGSCEVLRFSMEDIDRAIIDGNSKGMIKLVVDQQGKILGATILAHHAGDLLPELCLAIRCGLTLHHLADTVHAYPTLAELVWRTSREWQQSHAPRWFERLMRKLHINHYLRAR